MKKVLLVEDDVFVSDIYHVKLSGEGLDVTKAMNGAEALKTLEDGLVPDLILLDIVMPFMDGMDTLKALKKNESWKDIPVVMLTNLYDKARVDECLGLGARDYIIKSHFTPSEVLAKVRSLLVK